MASQITRYKIEITEKEKNLRKVICALPLSLFLKNYRMER